MFSIQIDTFQIKMSHSIHMLNIQIDTSISNQFISSNENIRFYNKIFEI